MTTIILALSLQSRSYRMTRFPYLIQHRISAIGKRYNAHERIERLRVFPARLKAVWKFCFALLAGLKSEAKCEDVVGYHTRRKHVTNYRYFNRKTRDRISILTVFDGLGWLNRSKRSILSARLQFVTLNGQLMEKAKRLLELNHPKTAQPKSEIEIKNSITSAVFKQEGITRSFRALSPHYAVYSSGSDSKVADINCWHTPIRSCLFGK